jgi:hypothetical protein
MIRLSFFSTPAMRMRLPLILFFCLLAASLWTQKPCPYTRLSPHHLAQSYWRYLHMTHATTGQVVHQGGDAYPSFLHFHDDYTVRIHTNGWEETFDWVLHKGLLTMDYRGKSQFCGDLSPSGLLLLFFEREGSPTTYAYHFEEVIGEETPFLRSPAELPTILLDAGRERDSRSGRHPWWAFWRWWQTPQAEPPPLIPMSIEISGGGYYGGLNPVYRQFLRIDSDGRLIRELHTRQEGVLKTRKNVPRRELEQFMDWIIRQGYFELEAAYDCRDPACTRRKSITPSPVPLQVAIRHGYHRKVVTVHIWGRDHLQEQWLPYPSLIDQIVHTVYKMADRPD